jgi:hypothetical protein
MILRPDEWKLRGTRIGLAHNPQLCLAAMGQWQGGNDIKATAVVHWHPFDPPILQPGNASEQLAQFLCERPFQGRSRRLAYVHGISHFHGDVNMAYFVNMLKDYFQYLSSDAA